ncbi:histidine kinase, partial [Streptomyces albiflaviniger]|nr:histidine kinase [Streptomyces albiflaviniger]
ATDAAAEGVGNESAPRSARVTVTARADAGELTLRVSDTGAGLDPAAAEEVFRRGWSTKSAGRGLGLALVQQAARRNAGTVEVTTSPDGGAQFTARLPLTAPAVTT